MQRCIICLQPPAPSGKFSGVSLASRFEIHGYSTDAHQILGQFVAVKDCSIDSRVGAQLRNDRGQVAHTRLPRRRQSSLLYGVVKPGIFTFTARRAPPLFSTQSESVGFVVVKYWNDRQGHYAPSILGNSELGEMYDGDIVDAWVRVTSTVCDFVCICVRVCAACPRSAQQRKLSTQKLVGMQSMAAARRDKKMRPQGLRLRTDGQGKGHGHKLLVTCVPLLEKRPTGLDMFRVRCNLYCWLVALLQLCDVMKSICIRPSRHR